MLYKFLVNSLRKRGCKAKKLMAVGNIKQKQSCLSFVILRLSRRRTKRLEIHVKGKSQ